MNGFIHLLSKISLTEDLEKKKEGEAKHETILPLATSHFIKKNSMMGARYPHRWSFLIGHMERKTIWLSIHLQRWKCKYLLRRQICQQKSPLITNIYRPSIVHTAQSSVFQSQRDLTFVTFSKITSLFG